MCSAEKLDLILKEFSRQAKVVFGSKLADVILFGSYARKDFDCESDVDIAILAYVSREEERSYNSELIKVMGDIYDKFGYDVVLSPIVISNDFYMEWKDCLPFYKNVANEGVRIVA